MGASGSGKSTLMAILGCLDRPTSGHYFFEGVDVARLDRAGARAHPQRAPRVRVPELQPAGAHQRARERRAAAVLRRAGSGRGAAPRLARARAGAGAARSRRARAQHAGPALRRPAAARRHRPGADQRAEPAAGGRADRQPRYPHLARDHGDAACAQPRAGRHHHRRHARGGHRRLCRSRGDHARRPDHLRRSGRAEPSAAPSRAATRRLDAPTTAGRGADRAGAVLGVRADDPGRRRAGARRATRCARCSPCSACSSASPR